MTQRISKAKEEEAFSLLRARVPQREISRRLGISKSAVSRLAALVKAPTAPPRKPEPAPPAIADIKRAVLSKAVRDAENANDDLGVAKASLALYCHDHPNVARWLREGHSLVDALISQRDRGDELLLLRAPEDVAALARLVVEDPGEWERDDGESDEAFSAFLLARGEAERLRAVELLATALEIAKTAPLSQRWTAKP